MERETERKWTRIGPGQRGGSTVRRNDTQGHSKADGNDKEKNSQSKAVLTLRGPHGCLHSSVKYAPTTRFTFSYCSIVTVITESTSQLALQSTTDVFMTCAHRDQWPIMARPAKVTREWSQRTSFSSTDSKGSLPPSDTSPRRVTEADPLRREPAPEMDTRVARGAV